MTRTRVTFNNEIIDSVQVVIVIAAFVAAAILVAGAGTLLL